MKVVNVILFEIGICALEDTNLIYRKQFYNPEIEYSSIIQGEKNYISDLIPKLRNYDQVRVNNKNLIEIFQQENFEVKLMSDSRQDEINQNKLDLIIKFGLSDDRDELVWNPTKVCNKSFIYESKRDIRKIRSAFGSSSKYFG